MVVLVILSLLGISMFVTQIKQIDASESPLLASCFIIMYVYLFSLVDFLAIGIYSIIIIGIISIPLSVVLQRKRLADYFKQFLNPGFILFVFLIIILYPICKPIVSGAWDEYSHWALIVKNILSTNSLPEAGGAVLYMSYPPAISLFQYLFMKLSSGSEGMMYYAQAILLASCFSALLKGQSFKKSFFILMAILIPLAVMIKFSVHNTFNIFPDTLMAVIAISCFAMYYCSDRKYSDMLKITPILFVLCLVRINAISFAGIIILLIGTDQISRNGIKKIKTWVQVMSLFLALIISFGSWQMHLSAMNIKSVVTQIIPFDMPRLSLTVSSFISAIFKTVLGNVNPLMTIFSYMTSTFAILIYILLLTISMQFILKEKKEVLKNFNVMSIVLFIGWILYSFGLIYSYMYSFTEMEGVRVASFHRYMGTYFVFWLIGIAYMMTTILANEKFKKGIAKKSLIGVTVLILVAIVGLSNPFKLNIIGDRRTENVYTEEAISHAEFIHEAIGNEAKVYLIFQKTRGYIFMGTRYHLATNPANLGTWSMGEPYSDVDTWTARRTAREFLDVLYELNYEYIYIGKDDDEFWHMFGELFDKPDSGNKIYKVTNSLEYPLVAVE